MAVPGSNLKEMIAFVNDSGMGAIGTPVPEIFCRCAKIQTSPPK